MECYSYIWLLVVFGSNVFAGKYNVNEEIAELREMYGNQVVDAPCKYKPTCSKSFDKIKRSIFSSDLYCHDKLGCFPTDGDFSDRFVNFKPNSRETIDAQFRLFTRKNKKNGQKLVADDLSTLTNSYFSSDLKTKFVIHGFLESTNALWFEPLNAELLQNGDYNVINVDWGGLRASKTLYTQATANTRVVAAEIVYLLKSLMKTKSLSLSDVHLIGHSLGAHIAGYVGKNLSASIERISGLDPAEPYFQGYSSAIRLDPSDAKFVDVIHSDADSITEIIKGEGGFGSSELSGHVDFFPNGGEDQPNCKNGIVSNVKLENDLYEGLKRFFACDHDRAIKYFTESVNDCRFTGIRCSNYKDYEAGKCSISCGSTDQCNSMGFHAHKPAVSGYKKYYLHTTGTDGSFCATGFQVKVKIDRISSEFRGALDITVADNRDLKKTFQVNKEKALMKAGETHTYQLGLTDNLDEIVNLEVVWTRDVSWWRVITKACGFFGFCNNAIKIHEVLLTSDGGKRYYFCGADKPYKSGVARSLFYSKNSCPNN